MTTEAKMVHPGTTPDVPAIGAQSAPARTFTAGPWHWYDAREDDPTADPPYEVFIRHKGSIAYVRRPEDARLIAAAPDLLDALRRVVAQSDANPQPTKATQSYPGGFDVGYALASAHAAQLAAAAIAKATQP